jgi:hypothetical protein
MDEQLKLKIEQAATSMLNDEEICVSLNITEETLYEYREVVERSRILLKQKLNAKRIADAATQGGEAAGQLVEVIPRAKISSRGGYRPGSGRKPGTTQKLSSITLLVAIENTTGAPLEEHLAQGYSDSIQNNDKSTRLQYEKMFLSKVVADKISMDITESEDVIEAKKIAFQEVIAQIALSQKVDK